MTVYIVMDNPSAHWTPEIRRWALHNKRRPAGDADQRQPLNRIECHFWALPEFVIKGSDYRDRREFTKAAQA